MAYVSDESGRDEVYVQNFPDRSEKWQISTRGGDDPRWSAGGKEMFYLSPEQQMMSVPVHSFSPFELGVPAPLFNAKVMLPGQQRAHYAVTPDAQTFILFTPAAVRSAPTNTVVVNWMAELTKR